MTTYAIPQTVPDDCDYLTAGKRYRVTYEREYGAFDVYDDDGDRIISSWQDCFHLNGGNWTRVEGDEE